MCTSLGCSDIDAFSNSGRNRLASHDKITLVTGAKARLGKEIALGLARAGHHVAVHCRENLALAEVVATEICHHGGRAIAVQADLASAHCAGELIQEVHDQLGPLTGMVNNASLFEWDDWSTATPGNFAAHMNVNLLAPLLLSQAFARQLPAMTNGSIVNIIDQRVWNLTPAYLTYTLSKAGLWTLTQTLAQALAPRIRVNGVGPGPTLPNVRQTLTEFATEAAATLLAEPVSPASIVEAVLFLMNASSVTGQMIAVDSGQHLAWQTADALQETRKN
jgi:NAD(P)-dependent dehydrogenase (short-subunit alcohol dehydrogenase family)